MVDTPDNLFLRRLVTAARTYGWSGDYIEITKFVLWTYQQYGYEAPELKDLEPLD